MPRQRIELPAVQHLSILDADGRVDEALEPEIPPADLRRLYRPFPSAGSRGATRPPDGIRALRVCVPRGTHVPHAVGLAYAARYKREDSVTLCYFGDGAGSEGVTQEALNFAGVFAVPLVFVC